MVDFEASREFEVARLTLPEDHRLTGWHRISLNNESKGILAVDEFEILGESRVREGC